MPPLPTQTLTTAGGQPYTVLLTQTNGIPYIELAEGYTENYTEGSAESIRRVACRWQDRRTLVRDFLGFSTYIPGGLMVGGVSSNLHRQIPEFHPYYNNDLIDPSGLDTAPPNPMVAVDARWVGGWGVPPEDTSDLAQTVSSLVNYGDDSASMMDQATGGIVYALAVYDIVYRFVQWQVLDDQDVPTDPFNLNVVQGELSRYIIREARPAAESLPIGGNYFQYHTAEENKPNQPIPESPPLVFPTAELWYTWEQIPRVPINNILTTIGTINAIAFDNNLYDAGTLLCLPPTIDLYMTAAGDRAHRVKYIFSYRATGWNFFYRKSMPPPKGPPGFDLVESIDATHTPPYLSTDFMKLFQLSGEISF